MAQGSKHSTSPLLSRLAEQHRTRKQARITRRALGALRHDPHLCKDIGLDPTDLPPRGSSWKTLW
ncbi:hypothetical protein IV417_03300 [Alphaproteobacteria bacterium KMM 3653]|uniref:DUF1127 domain-containing protein n=1 Tax=Harenicola maris TaxID=2841044 RepID=A0AAP2CMT8_9RHOB|nr:hypothetical protein [Harenicola maris]